jgi:predicted amidohydrolase
VASAQCASREDVAADVATAVELVRAAEGARLLLLPELFLGGYGAPTEVIDADDARLDPLQDVAAETGTTVLTGAALRGEHRPRIGLLSVGPTGRRRVYDKQHLSGDEQQQYEPGESGTILEVDGWLVGTAICYDVSFPEHARVAADAGAHLYLASVAFFPGGAQRRDLYVRARALDNGMYAVLSGLSGSGRAGQHVGGAGIYDPEGRPLTELGPDGVVIADLDPDLVATTRQQHPMLAERRALGDVRRSIL